MNVVKCMMDGHGLRFYIVNVCLGFLNIVTYLRSHVIVRGFKYGLRTVPFSILYCNFFSHLFPPNVTWGFLMRGTMYSRLVESS